MSNMVDTYRPTIGQLRDIGKIDLRSALEQHLRPVSSLVSPIKEMKYRMVNFFENQPPKVNILISWLFIFLASLEYQLDPFYNQQPFFEEAGVR
mmetsp:Transcript_35934/g.55202  ORF Transcript_35934/g.55202 Transcript_35934/m.55202 type:complete len:94 (-) Transcript_35934:1773-2054(-)